MLGFIDCGLLAKEIMMLFPEENNITHDINSAIKSLSLIILGSDLNPSVSSQKNFSKSLRNIVEQLFKLQHGEQDFEINEESLAKVEDLAQQAVDWRINYNNTNQLLSASEVEPVEPDKKKQKLDHENGNGEKSSGKSTDSRAKRKTTKKNLNKKKPRTKPLLSPNGNLNTEVKSGKKSRNMSVSQSVSVKSECVTTSNLGSVDMKSVLDRKKKGQILCSQGVIRAEVSEAGTSQVAAKPSNDGKSTANMDQGGVLHDVPEVDDTEKAEGNQAGLPKIEGKIVGCDVNVAENINSPTLEWEVSTTTEEGVGPSKSGSGEVVVSPTETSGILLGNTCSKTEAEMDGAKSDVKETQSSEEVIEVSERSVEVNECNEYNDITPQEDVAVVTVVKKDATGAQEGFKVVEECVRFVEEDVKTAENKVEIPPVCDIPKKRKTELEQILSFNKLLSSFEGSYVSPRRAAVAAKLKIENSSSHWAFRRSTTAKTELKTVPRGKASAISHPAIHDTIMKHEDFTAKEDFFIKPEDVAEVHDDILKPEVATETEETILKTGNIMDSQETVKSPDIPDTIIEPYNANETVLKSTSVGETSQLRSTINVEMVCGDISREERDEGNEDTRDETSKTKSDEEDVLSGQENELKISVSSLSLGEAALKTSVNKLKVEPRPHSVEVILSSEPQQTEILSSAPQQKVVLSSATQQTEVLSSENDESKAELSAKTDLVQDTEVTEEGVPNNNDLSNAETSCGASEPTSKPKRQRRPSKKMLDSLDSVNFELPLRRSRRKSAMSCLVASKMFENVPFETKLVSLPDGNSSPDLEKVISNSIDIDPSKNSDGQSYKSQSNKSSSPVSEVLPPTSRTSSSSVEGFTGTKTPRKTPKKFTVIKKPLVTAKVVRCSVRTKKITGKEVESADSCNLETNKVVNKIERSENINGSLQQCLEKLPQTEGAVESCEANTSVDDEIEVSESLRHNDFPPDVISGDVPDVTVLVGPSGCQTGNVAASTPLSQPDITGQMHQTDKIPDNVSNTTHTSIPSSSASLLKPGSTVYIISHPGSRNVRNNTDLRHVGSILRSLNLSQLSQSLRANQVGKPTQTILLPNAKNRNAPVPMLAYRCQSKIVPGPSGADLSSRNVFQLHSAKYPPQNFSADTSDKATKTPQTISTSLSVHQNVQPKLTNSARLAKAGSSNVEKRQTYANVTQQLLNGLAQQPVTPTETALTNGNPTVSQDTSQEYIKTQCPKIESRNTYASAAQQLLKDLAAMSVQQVGK
ncbi:hypothetical protein ACHWQZ_G004999 [Mnemiopsis leidyi]